MSPNLGSVENTKKIINSGNTRQNKRPQFIIPKKDTPVAYYAKMTGMTEEEFMKWTGVKTSTLKYRFRWIKYQKEKESMLLQENII